ncbi:MAG TPA: H(+)/Cl(-) exchange transporter ClcA [Terriglobales bacterium]|jgi:CIC family chloride channel protein|nr:H(+)/Cl(-) exchange transporter ClcA [Terriglobales bacterium]
MNSKPERAGETAGQMRSLFVLAFLAPIAGAAAGILGALFRLALARADRLRDEFVVWSHGRNIVGFLLVVTGCASATGIAAWLVRRFSPDASGSGIPQVEAVLEGRVRQAPFILIPVKFLGGLLAIGAGLALGREGPSVQMGASIAHLVGKIFKRNWPDCRVLLAAGAGAGLATAFNAPVAGAIFVLEELVRRFEPRIAIVALGASSTAIAVARLFLGDAPDFHVRALAFPSNGTKFLFFVLGALCGLAAIAYNHAILGAIAAADRLRGWPVELRAAMIGAGIGSLAWFAPELVGGGDPITQRTLQGIGTLAMIPLLFSLRFGLGAISYAAATPGGLFAPLLVLGAQLGLFFGLGCQLLFSGLQIQPEAFAVVGMAAFFAGVVRAPLTGIALVTEMTGNVTMLLPMMGGCFAAMLVTAVLRNPPIYDSLSTRVLPASRSDYRAPVGSSEHA